MRHGSTIVPAGLVLAAALLGAGGGRDAPPADWVRMLDERFGMPVAPIYLLLRPDVQGDLQLNPRQIAGARDMVGRLIDRLLNLKLKSEPDAVKAERRQIDEQMATWLRQELSPAQCERLTQINLQWEGASALRRSAVVEYLRLDEAQSSRVHDLLADRDQRWIKGTLQSGEFDRLSREALNVLTPLQKEQWDRRLGPPCRFAIGQPARAPGQPAAGAGLKGQPRPPGR
jgi:hypothetical protein